MNSLCSRLPLIVLAGASLLLAACAEQRDVVAPELSASAAVASAAPSLPNATYAMTLVPDDFPPLVPLEIVELLSGDWELDLTDPRSYVVHLNDEVVVEGRYTANPARFVLNGGSGPLACVGEPGIGQGVYDWSLEGDELSLAVVHDNCGGRGPVLTGRAFVLTVKPWEKQ